jgi:hypothetical protein
MVKDMKGAAMKGSVTRFAIIFTLTGLLLGVWGNPSFSAESQERESLRGVEAFGVFVRVRAGDAGAKKLGITREKLQRDVEARLGKAGIRIAENVGPHLLLSVSLISISHPTVDGILAYLSSVQLKFRQGAVLDASSVRTTATTWDEIRFGARTPTKYLDKHIRQSIGALVDAFVSDYLAVNPEATDTTQRSRPAPAR